MFQHPWDNLIAYVSPLLRSASSGIMESTSLDRSLLGVHCSFWPEKEWFTDLLSLLVKEPFELPLLWNLLVQPHIRKFHCGLGISAFTCGSYPAPRPKGWLFERGCGARRF